MSKYNNHDGMPSYTAMIAQSSSVNSFNPIGQPNSFLKTQLPPQQKNLKSFPQTHSNAIIPKQNLTTKTSLGLTKNNNIFKNSEATFLKKQTNQNLNNIKQMASGNNMVSQQPSSRLNTARQQKQLVAAYQAKNNKFNQKSVPSTKKAGQLKHGIVGQNNRKNQVFSPPPSNQNTRAMFHKPTMNNLAKSEMSDFNSQSPRPVNNIDNQGFYSQQQLSPPNTVGIKSPRYGEVANDYKVEGSRTQLNTHRVNQRTDLAVATNQLNTYREQPSATNITNHYTTNLKGGMITQSQRDITQGQKIHFVDGENFSFNEKRNLNTNNFSPIPSNIGNAYSTQNLQQIEIQGGNQQLSNKTVQNSMQRQMNSIQNQTYNTNIRQNNKTLSQYLMGGKQKQIENCNISPFNGQSLTQLQPYRIQRGHIGDQMASARIFSQEPQPQANRIFSNEKLHVQTPLSEISQRLDSQDQRRDLLKAGVNRRMEGVSNIKKENNNYQLNNVKDTAHRLNFNSMDREDPYDEKNKLQISSRASQNRNVGGQQPNYMKNTQSREMHILCKKEDNIGSSTSFGLNDGVAEDDSINEVKSAPTKRNKSAYKGGQMMKKNQLGFTTQQQSNQKLQTMATKPGHHTNQLSILSFDNLMQLKQNSIQNANYLTSRQQAQNQTTGKLSHRRDRSQRINKNKNNEQDCELNSDIDDTQVISIGFEEKTPNTEIVGEDQLDYPNYLQTDLQKKKMVSASVASLTNLTKEQKKSIINQKQTPTPNKRIIHDMNRYTLNEQATSVATPNIYKPTISQKNKTINFIQRNIKRAGISKERHTGIKANPSRENITSPTRPTNANNIYSIGSIGSIGSPLSSNINPSPNELSAKRNKGKKIQKLNLNFGMTQTPSNLHGNTGTTGGSGGTGIMNKNYGGYSMKAFKDAQSLKHKIVPPGGGIPSGSQRSLAQFQSQKLKALKTQRAAPVGDTHNFEDNDIASIKSGELNQDKVTKVNQYKNITNLHGSQITNSQQHYGQHLYGYSSNSIQQKQIKPHNKGSYVSNNSTSKSKQSISHSHASTSGPAANKQRSRGKPLADSQYIHQMPDIVDPNINMYDIDDINDQSEQRKTQQFNSKLKTQRKSNTKSQKSAKSTKSNRSRERMLQLDRQNKQIRQQDILYKQKQEAIELHWGSHKQINLEDSSNMISNQLREQLKKKGFLNELQSQGSSADIDHSNFIINQPNIDINKQKDMKQQPNYNQKLDTQREKHKFDQYNKSHQIGSGLISPKAYVGQSPDMNLNVEQFGQESYHSDEIKRDKSVEDQRQTLQNEESGLIKHRKDEFEMKINDGQQQDNSSQESLHSENQDKVNKMKLINDSQVTTQTELQRYANQQKNVSKNGMIQATIYHIRRVGENIHNPQEREQYYSDDFLINQRHVNFKVEQELEEFKIEISEKVEANNTKLYSFPRPGGQQIHMNTDSNVIDISHSQSQYHELPNYDDQTDYHRNQKEYADQSLETHDMNNTYKAQPSMNNSRKSPNKHIDKSLPVTNIQNQYSDQKKKNIHPYNNKY